MNVYEAMRVILVQVVSHNVDLSIALDEIESVADAYNALAPDWDSAPEWAQWCTLFDNGKLIWWELEPEARIMPNGQYAWTEKDGRMGRAKSGQVSPLPEHIDWRDCKWQRPEVTA